MGIVVGVDWGNKRHAIVALDEAGQVVHEEEVAHEADSLGATAARLRELARDGDVRVGIERSHGVIVDVLCGHDFEVFAWNPKQTDAWRSVGSNSGAKDDRRDAKAIADALRVVPECFHRIEDQSAEITEMRELVTSSTAIVSQVVANKNQVWSALSPVLPTLMAILDLETVWSRRLLRLILKAEKPWLVRRATIARAVRGVRKVDVDDVQRRLKTDAGTATKKSWRGARGRATAFLDMLEMGQEVRDRIEADRVKLLGDWLDSQPEQVRADIAIIRSMPGAGAKLVSTLIAFAWPSVQARDREHLRRLSGVAPVTSQTGRRGRPRRSEVSRRLACNHHLREVFHHWGRIAVQRDERARQRYAELRARGHTFGRAMRQLTDGLLRVLCAALENGQPYDANYAQAA